MQQQRKEAISNIKKRNKVRQKKKRQRASKREKKLNYNNSRQRWKLRGKKAMRESVKTCVIITTKSLKIGGKNSYCPKNDKRNHLF